MMTAARGVRVRPIPTKKSYTTTNGDVVIPVWVTRDGHHQGDADLVLAADDPPSRLADVLSDPAQIAHIAQHAHDEPGAIVHPLDESGGRSVTHRARESYGF